MKKYYYAIGIVGGCYISYKIGKIVGTIKTLKFIADLVEDIEPGFKRNTTKIMAENLIDGMFDHKENNKDQD